MKRYGLIILLVLVGLLLAGSLIVLNQMHRSLGPGLELTRVKFAAPTATQLLAPSSEAPAATQTIAISTEALAPTRSSAQPGVAARNICGGQGAISLLVIGLALPENAYQRGAGAIRLVRVDYDHPGAAVLALPPDLLVEAHEGDTLTQVYWLARQNTPGDEEERNRNATQALAQALLDNYGYAPDHYITINQSGFGEMIDSLGGIVVNIPEAIQEVPEGWHTFEAGEQTLGGDQLLDYVRLINRVNQTYQSERDRLGRQNRVIQAALDAALKPANWGKLPLMMKDMEKLLVTDLSADQLVDLACMFREVGGQARSLAIPPQAASTDEQGRVTVDPEIVRALIKDLEEE
jgi:LCP family protein required for cell wall assembly